jgi:hypothetical protein
MAAASEIGARAALQVYDFALFMANTDLVLPGLREAGLVPVTIWVVHWLSVTTDVVTGPCFVPPRICLRTSKIGASSAPVGRDARTWSEVHCGDAKGSPAAAGKGAQRAAVNAAAIRRYSFMDASSFSAFDYAPGSESRLCRQCIHTNGHKANGHKANGHKANRHRE